MRAERGFTYFELLATILILMILATAILPTAKVLRKRQKEIELRRELRILRTAVDGYHDAVRQGKIADRLEALIQSHRDTAGDAGQPSS